MGLRDLLPTQTVQESTDNTKAEHTHYFMNIKTTQVRCFAHEKVCKIVFYICYNLLF